MRGRGQWGAPVGFGHLAAGSDFHCGKVMPVVGLVMEYGFLSLSLTFCISKTTNMRNNQNPDLVALWKLPVGSAFLPAHGL